MVKNARAMIANQLKGEGRETVDWILYDSLFTTAASSTMTLTFFQNTIGTAGRARTNMKAAGLLPNPMSMIVTELACKIFNTAGTPFFFAGGATPSIHPVNVMMSQCTFDFKLEPSTEYEGHGSQLWDNIDYMNDTGTTLGVNNFPLVNYKSLKLKNPIIIPPNRSFSLAMTLTTPAAALGYTVAGSLIMWYLKGLLRRNN